MSIKKLQQMDDEQKRSKYRNVPEYALPKSKYNDSTANGLTQAIIKFITLKKGFASRTSSAGRYLVKERKYIPSTTRKGYPDIAAVIGGKSVYIEVKAGSDKMRPDQLKVKAEIEAANGMYFIAKDFDSFLRWYQDQFEN
jgi:hypothetical protein